MANNGLITPGVQNNKAADGNGVGMIAGGPLMNHAAAQETANSVGATGNPANTNNSAIGDSSNTGGNAMGSPTNPNSAATQPQYTKKQTTDNLYDANGNVGVRQSLINRGVNTNRIGWNGETGNVTLDGKDILLPNYVSENGISYASQAAIDRITNAAYSQAGDELVGASAYSAQAGLGNLVKWDPGTQTVSVGGRILNPVYVSEAGIAYVKKSEIDAAIAATKQNAGVEDNHKIYSDWAKEYGSQITEAADALKNYSYDPNKDNEYQAYAKLAMQQIYKEAQDAAARAADLNGGYGGVNAAAIASAIYNAQQKIAAAIPEYAKQDYDRRRDRLDDAIRVGNEDYNKAYQANRDAINDYQNALDKDYQRILDERDWSETMADRKQTDIENASINFRNKVDDDRYIERADRSDRYDDEMVEGQDIANALNKLNLDLGYINALGTISKLPTTNPNIRNAWNKMSGKLGLTINGEFVPLNEIYDAAGMGRYQMNPNGIIKSPAGTSESDLILGALTQLSRQ